ncbi:MAG: patatin-like phospholipase family protein [Acidobacteriota bacterium]|jgi:NTE family protein|nr:patatin-like phospholipase family protein [Acidobacteriota bacterium]
MTDRTRRIICLLCCSIFLLPGAGFALADEESAPQPPQGKPPKVALVLSGGGARGAAHIGILKVLQREGVPIDCIAGVSMGALTGGLYAVGYSPADIERFLAEQDWNSLFSDAPQWRFTPLVERADTRYQGKIALRGLSPEIPGGLFSGQRFTEALDVLTAAPMLRAQNDFDKLPIPFRAVATNLVDGKPYVFRQGSLTQAVRASIAVPMMFTPVETEDALLVDGGLVDNLPTGIARDMGADIVIAIDVSSPLLQKGEMRTLFSVVDQSISLQMERNVQESKKLATLVLTPNLDGYSNTNYDRLPEIIKRGEEEAELRLQEIKALVRGIPPHSHPEPAPTGTPPVIDSIAFSGLNKVSARQVADKISLRAGDLADPAAIADDVSRIYATRLFETVSYTLEPVGGDRYRLIFRVREELMNTLGAGIRYDNDYDFTILAEFVARQLFRSPSRVVVSSQFGGVENHSASFRYTPAKADFLYLEPKVEISRLERQDKRDKVLVDTYTDKREGGQFLLGGTFFRQLELSGGYRLDRVRVAGGVAPRMLAGTSTLAGLSARLNWNSFDNPEYPSSGSSLDMRFAKRHRSFGSDYDNLKGSVDYRKHIPLPDESTIRMQVTLGYSEGDTPFFDQFFVGGFSPSSLASRPFLGFDVDEITAQQMAVGGVSYYRQIFTKPLSVLKRGYLTATYNTGFFSERASAPYAFQNWNGIGVGMALDTRIGPLRMTLGWGERGRVNFHLSFGPSF